MGFDMLKKAIILGGHNNHVALAKKMKDRGYYTILVDYLDHPPAADYTDEHVQISTFDTEGIYELAKSRQVDLIINTSLEHLNKGIAYVAERLNLPMMYSYETACDVSNKKRMKTIMVENGVPTTPFVLVDNIDEIKDISLRYPLFVKPVDGSGSTGVNRAATYEELEKFTAIALRMSKSGGAIIEEEAFGKECNVYCVIRDGIAEVLTFSEKYSDIGGVADVTKAIGTIWPARVSEAAFEEIKRAAQKIAEAFKLKTTPMFMQLKVNGDEINIIEFACRMAGGYSYKNILGKLGFDYYDFTIDAFEGKRPEVIVHDNGKMRVIHSLYASPCIFDRIDGYTELVESGYVIDFAAARHSGTEISDISANKSKIGFFIVQDDSVENLLDKVSYVFDHIEAYDMNGNKVLRRDCMLKADMLK